MTDSRELTRTHYREEQEKQRFSMVCLMGGGG